MSLSKQELRETKREQRKLYQEYFAPPPPEPTPVSPEVEEWRQQITEKYPSEAYRVEWTPEGALVYQKPTVKERLAEAALRRQEYKGLGIEAGMTYVMVPQAEAKPKPLTPKQFMEATLPKEVKATRTYPGYRYLEIRKAAKWLGEAYAKTPKGILEQITVTKKPVTVTRPERGLMYISGFAKGLEAYGKPEIPTAFGSVLSGKLDEYGESIKGYEPELLGELTFEYLFATYGVGPIVGAGWGELKGAWRGSRLDVWLAKHWKWYYAKTAGIARGEVAGRIGGWKRAIAYETLPKGYGFKPVSVPKAWFDFTLAPRTGGVLVKGYGPLVKSSLSKILPTTTVLGGRIIGYKVYPAPWEIEPAKLIEGAKSPLSFKKYTWRMGKRTSTYFERAFRPTVKDLAEKGLLPFVTQAQVTRMGIIPFIPKVTSSSLSRSFKSILAGFTASTLLRGFPQATARPKRRYKRKLVPISIPRLQPFEFEKLKFKGFQEEFPRGREKETVVPIIKVAPIQSIKVKLKQFTEQETKQRQALIPRFWFPPTKAPPIPPPPPPPTFKFPREKRRKRVRKWWRGEWFLRVHPIPTPSQVAKQFGGLTSSKLADQLAEPLRTTRRKRRR